MHEISLKYQIPAEWKLRNLGDCCFVTKLAGFEYTLYFDYSQGGEIIAIRVLNIKNGHFDLSNIQTIPLAVSKKLPRSILNKDDLVISYVGTIGEVALIEENHRFHLAPNVAKISPEQAIISSRFLLHQLMSQHTQKHLIDLGTLTSQPALSMSNLRKLPLIIPHPLEQRRIVEILDTTDAKIQTSEKLIAKLKLIQTGLQHDLLTQGINEHGDIRDPMAHPEQFKDTPLGKIPKEWVLTTMGAIVLQGGGVIQTGPFGSQLHAHEYIKEGIPVIMPQDIQDEHIIYSQIAHVPPAKAKKLARHRVELNDVVFARRGDLSQCTSIGAKEVGYICGTGCLLVKNPGKFLCSAWLVKTYRHDYSQRQILARAVGSTMVNLNTTLLSNLVIALPSYEEQVSIAAKLETYNVRIITEESHLAKLRLLKQGLMQNLLTGRVRVTDLSTEDANYRCTSGDF